MKKSSFILIVLFLTSQLSGQTVSFFSKGYFIEKFTAKDGFPGTSVANIIQDKNGFIWLATHGGLVRFDGINFKVFQVDPKYASGSYKNFIYTIHEDRQGQIWAGTLNQGVLQFDPATEQFIQHFSYDSTDVNSLPYNWISDIEEDQSGRLWISTQVGLSQLTRELDQFRFEHFFADSGTTPVKTHLVDTDHYVLSSNGVRPFRYHQDSSLWFYSRQGLDRLTDTGFQRVLLLPDPQSTENDPPFELSAMANSREGWVWIAGKRETGNGDQNILAKWFPKENTFRFTNQPLPNDVSIDHLYEDETGRIWLGTWGRGLFVLHAPFSKNEQLDHVPLEEHGKSQTGNIWAFHPDDFGNLWVGTWGNYLFKIQLARRKPEFIQLPAEEPNVLTPAHLALDTQANLWITASGRQLFQKVAGTEEIRTFTIPLPNVAGTSRKVPPIVVGPAGNIWLGGYQAVYRFNPASGQFSSFSLSRANKELENDWVHALAIKGDDLWCGTAHGSLYRFAIPDEAATPIHEEYTNLGIIQDILITQNDILLASTSKGVHKIDMADPEKRNFLSVNGGGLDLLEIGEEIWLSSYLGGIQQVDLKRDTVSPAAIPNAPETNWVNGLISDRTGNVWMLGPGGFLQYLPDQQQFSKPGILNKFALPEVSAVTGKCEAPDGKIYIAGLDGIISFHPDSLEFNVPFPRPVITEVLVNNAPVTPPKRWQSSVLDFTHRENSLAVSYTALQFANPHAPVFQYRLLGLSDEWVMVGAERTARFSGLSPGKYTFQLQALNSKGLSSGTTEILHFHIAAPWWRSRWALAVYLLFLAAAAYTIYRFLLHRRLAVQETRRLQELDRWKSQLYTNITHEFRTPLTVIEGMAKLAEKQFRSGDEAAFRQGVNAVKRNTRQLLSLINQMLDLAKVEAGALEIQPIQGDVTAYLVYLAESFHSLAESRQIQLTIYKEPEQVIMDFDPDKLMHIVANLLSNAIKFTPERGKVIFHIRRETPEDKAFLVLKIKDTGKGIDQKEIPYIFDRFYQADSSSTRRSEGTGLGLALTKELVELMGGQIRVQSSLREGSTFTVSLPVTNRAPFEAPRLPEVPILSEPPTIIEHFQSTNEDKPTILIVEDNKDVQNYISSFLENIFQLKLAHNGQLGLENAREGIPDLIISDIMMPEMDGLELCRLLKRDERTSHIPVILLTARADSPSKIKGLEGGADAYLTKPFNEQELLVRIKSLLNLRRRLQQRYQQAQPFEYEPEGGFRQEDRFIKRVQILLETNLADEDFTVEMLSRELGMSRSQVFKKIKALTGRSIAQYMRSYRLHRAEQLLRTTSLSISEIAYSVGFKDPAYFSRVFSKTFGQSPSETRNNL